MMGEIVRVHLDEQHSTHLEDGWKMDEGGGDVCCRMLR